MIMALTVSTICIESLLEGSILAMYIYSTGKKPKRSVLK